MCRWETLPCTWKCSLFRMDFSHQHWKQREPSWESTSDSRLTSSMLKSKCEQRERDPVYTENDWTGTYLRAPVRSCCCITHTVSGGREGPLWLVLLLFLTLGGATVISKEVKYSPASKIHTKHFMSPAIHLWWQFKKTGSEQPQCLRPVNALSLITESTPARSYKTEQTETADPQSADRFLICKSCADIFIKTYLK